MMRDKDNLSIILLGLKSAFTYIFYSSQQPLKVDSGLVVFYLGRCLASQGNSTSPPCTLGLRFRPLPWSHSSLRLSSSLSRTTPTPTQHPHTTANPDGCPMKTYLETSHSHPVQDSRPPSHIACLMHPPTCPSPPHFCPLSLLPIQKPDWYLKK